MQCPACERQMQQMNIGDITVDVCSGGCGGIWFDNFELQKVDERHEAAGEELLTVPRDPAVRVDYEAKRLCPRCDGVKMLKHFFSVKHEIEVDECGVCGGIWLDAGELGQIRGQFSSESERKDAAGAYFAKHFDGKLAQMRKDSQENLEKARKFAKMFRFICPSYYIPGKQEWGAF